MKVTVLGSGSSGNATLIEAGGTRILVDAGFSGRQLDRRLAAAGASAESLAGAVITHEHGDHTRGMGVLARRHGVRLFLTRITRHVCASMLRGTERVAEYTSAAPFRIGSLEVRPFLTAHDAADPVAVTVRDVESGDTFGIATDLGRPTAAVRHALAGCHLLLLEANHDEILLREGPYPWSVKQRIASSHGHLSNRAAADLARELYHPGLGGVILGHLSNECNVPDLAAEVVGRALDRTGFRGGLEVASQDEPMETVDVGELRRRGGGHEQLVLF